MAPPAAARTAGERRRRAMRSTVRPHWVWRDDEAIRRRRRRKEEEEKNEEKK